MRIVVLADDFSGAAELANVGAAHGLSAEVWTGEVAAVVGPIRSELVAIDCGTRSLRSKAMAAEKSREIAQSILPFESTLVFKKTDSVLRGHVAAECAAIASELNYQSVVLVPANPSRGRHILNGRYTIHKTPLEETTFGSDPEFPAATSCVRTLLDNQTGIDIRVPDVVALEDLERIASSLPPGVLLAGGADFFEALLRQHNLTRVTPFEPEKTDTADSLWICGSHAAWTRGLGEHFKSQGIPVTITPGTTTPSSESNSLPGLLAIGEGHQMGDHHSLLDSLISTAVDTITKRQPSRIFVEGGATAGALCQRMGWQRLTVSGASAEGIGILRPKGSRETTLWVKPGSYSWPAWALPRRA